MVCFVEFFGLLESCYRSLAAGKGNCSLAKSVLSVGAAHDTWASLVPTLLSSRSSLGCLCFSIVRSWVVWLIALTSAYPPPMRQVHQCEESVRQAIISPNLAMQ